MVEAKESKIAAQLYNESSYTTGKGIQSRFKKSLDYYNDLTGFGETEPNAIVHHFVELYGPGCEKCEKPYRTHQVKFCAACGN